MAQLKLTDLHPFKSALLCETTTKAAAGNLLQSIASELRTSLASREHIVIQKKRDSSLRSDNLEVSFFYYTEKTQAAWTDDEAFRDTTNHLMVICRRLEQLAIYTSDPVLLQEIRKHIGSNDGTALGQLRPISSGRLNAAFVQGAAQTLWLSGTHRRVPAKADNKVISGMDLRYALDPLGDQTYFFTAARCRTKFGAAIQTVGVSPRKSSIWIGPSSKWSDFATTVSSLLDTIRKVQKAKLDPLPTLANPTNDLSSMARVKAAYDVALIPPILFDPTVDEDTRKEAERWSEIQFDIKKTKGLNFTADIVQLEKGRGTLLGTLAFEFDLKLSGKLEWTVVAEPSKTASAGNQDTLRMLKKKLTDEKAWLKVWYESGHVLAEQEIFQVCYCEFPFQNYIWADLKSYDRDEEKPDPLSAENIGKQGSLFCWVKNEWRPDGLNASGLGGWLASNDGAMEIADFIHLDDVADPPVLTLIHVKAAKSSIKNRRISVSAYEIVTSQAIKNLRHVDEELLAGNFTQQLDKRIKDAVWYNGMKVDRDKMLSKLKSITANYARRVVVLQPQVTKTALAAARNGSSAEKLRAKQLDTLLLSAQATCQSVGADFRVICDNV